MNSTQQPTFAIGVDVGGTKLEAVVLDVQGRQLWRQRVPTPHVDYAATLQAIGDLIVRARQTLAGAPCTIGLGTPGSLTPAGLMKNSNSTALNGHAIQRDLESLLGQAVRLSNDANCLALSEATDGAGAGAEVVFAAILGTGIGAGIAVHGNVLNGPNGLAGEWGHNPLPWMTDADPRWRCKCGLDACIETFLCGPAVARDHAALHGGDLRSQEIAARAAAGDGDCDATLARWEHRLARGLAHVINLLDPDVIVLGGGLSQIERVYSNVPALWSQWVYSAGVRDPVRTRLLPSRHGDASGVRGAAWLWRMPAAAAAHTAS